MPLIYGGIMKKILAICALTLTSNFVYADKPLPVQYGEPEPLVNQGGYTPVVKYQNAPAEKFNNSEQSNASLFIEYSSQKGEFENDIDADINGFGIGISTSPQIHGYWGKFEYQSNSDYDGDYYELSAGGHLNFINTDRFYAIGTFGLGVGLVDVPDFDQSVYFTIPIGIEAGVNIAKNLSAYGGVGYKWALDISSPTTCNNGTQSSSVGSGTCSWHGGIDHYNYTVGDFNGITYKAGLRYNF